MIDPEISVIIPFYNRKETLRRSVASVLKQTFSNLELILVDDGSTDGSIETLGDLNDARLVVITQKNQGACQARNAGIFAARGKYIAFQDSDDVWRPDKLEKQITELKRTNSDVCFCRFQRHDTSGASIDVWPRINAGPVFEDDLVKESIVSTQTILAKREIFNHKMFNGGLKRLQDYEWVISTCRDWRYVLVGEVLVDVYLQNDSLTMSGDEKLNESCMLILKEHLSDFNDNPVLQAYLYENVGRSLARLNRDPGLYYKAALVRRLNIKTLIKFVLSCAHVYR